MTQLRYKETINKLEEELAAQKKLTQVLQTDRDRLKLILEKLPIGITMVDADDKYSYINPATTTMDNRCGDINQLLGKNIRVNHSEEVLQKVEKVLDAFKSGQMESYTREIVGGDFAAEVMYHAMCSDKGKYEGTIQILIDITERRKSEQEIRKLSRSIEQSPASVVITNTEGVIEYVNSKFSELTGYSYKEAIGKKPSILKSGMHSEEFYTDLWFTISSGERWKGELINKKKNGQLYWESTSISPIINKEGNITHFTAVKIDITKRKDAEAALEERNEELNTFIYKSSHDLRAPLASILGLINVSEMEVKDAEAAKYFALIKDRILTQDKILSELLRVSRIYGVVLKPEFLHPGATIKEILESKEGTGKAADIKFKFKDDHKKRIKTDILLFMSIVQNIVTNAIEYKNSAIKKPQIKVNITSMDNGVNITVEDNGIGIEEAVQPHVYNMFYRGHKDAQGSGLGLYITKKAVEKLGGNIKLNSTEGKGSAFTVFLPRLSEN